MMIDVGVDTEDSSAVAISSAAMSKLKIRIPTSFHVKRTAYNRKEPKESSLKGTGISEKSDHLSEEEYFEKQQWQKFNRQPWELVEQIWKETSANRILVIHQKDENKLILRLFVTSAKFYLKWNMNKEGIKRLMMERIKDKTRKNVFKSVYPENSGCREYGFFGFNIPVYFIGEDAALLYLLPLLLKPKKIALPLKEDTFWKPSKRDMQEAFVIHVQNPEDVLVTISRKQEKLSQMFLSMQPFVILQRKRPFDI
ncbi:hypothetical protein Avbf_05650 [Armadillidium vulgare]|nr:hypothetical protein Avbf_05650 [Armadillidium vulgare]